jgi:hypothetical protein
MTEENSWSDRDYRNIILAVSRLGWQLGASVGSAWSKVYTRPIFDTDGLYVGSVTYTPLCDGIKHDVRWFGNMDGDRLLAMLGDL